MIKEITKRKLVLGWYFSIALFYGIDLIAYLLGKGIGNITIITAILISISTFVNYGIEELAKLSEFKKEMCRDN